MNTSHTLNSVISVFKAELNIKSKINFINKKGVIYRVSDVSLHTKMKSIPIL